MLTALASPLPGNAEPNAVVAWVLHNELDDVDVEVEEDEPGPRKRSRVSIAQLSAARAARDAWERRIQGRISDKITTNISRLEKYQDQLRGALEQVRALQRARQGDTTEDASLVAEIATRRRIIDDLRSLQFPTPIERQCAEEQRKALRRARRRLQDVQRSTVAWEQTRKELEAEVQDVDRRVSALKEQRVEE